MRFSKKIFVFFSVLAVLALTSSTAFAQEAAQASANAYSMFSWLGIAAGLGIGIAAFGGALGQGRAVAAAMEGIARNPGSTDEVFVPFIIGLALIESLVIYAFVIALFVQNNIALSGTLQIAGG